MIGSFKFYWELGERQFPWSFEMLEVSREEVDREYKKLSSIALETKNFEEFLEKVAKLNAQQRSILRNHRRVLVRNMKERREWLGI